MPDWIPMVLWLCILVLAPLLGADAIRRRTLPRYRLPGSPGAPMDPRVWRLSDADTRNYAEPGKRVLRIFKVLKALGMVGYVVWMFVFIF